MIMPESSTLCKVDAVKQYGAKVITCPSTQEGRTEVGAKIIQERSCVFIHPSQNPEVIAGQGTLALEILEQNPYIDVMIAPVGGGGLISGLAIAAKSIRPSVKVRQTVYMAYPYLCQILLYTGSDLSEGNYLASLC